MNTDNEEHQEQQCPHDAAFPFKQTEEGIAQASHPGG